MQFGRELHNGMNTKGQATLGAILEAGCHPYRQFWVLFLSQYNHVIYIYLLAIFSNKNTLIPFLQFGSYESNSFTTN